MTPTMWCALVDAAEAPALTKHAGGWSPNMGHGYSTRTVEALVACGFFTIEGRADKMGARAIITEAGRNFVREGA